MTSLLGFATLAGCPRLLANTVRDRGRAAQVKLYERWGGAPTTQLLRMRGASTNPTRRDKWRVAVEETTASPLPSATDEERDPSAADDVYDVAVSEIRERTRDRTKFPLVFAENCSYGFERNLFGVRWFGRCVAIASTVVIAFFLVPGPRWSWTSRADVLVCLLADVVLLLVWIFLPTRTRVRRFADRYAEQLLNSAVVLEPRRK